MKATDVFVLLMVFLSVGRAAAVSLPDYEKRELCATIDTDLEFTVDGKIKNFGSLYLCLCDSDIDAFISGNAIASAAVDIVGKDIVKAVLEIAIQWGTSCSPAPSSKVKRNIPFVNAKCPSGHALCGVQSAWSKTAFECVDIDRDLESCGGCTVDYFGGAPSGRDCSSIEGIEEVACKAGRCVVFSCRYGFHVSPDGSDCIEANEANATSHHHMNSHLGLHHAS